MKVPTLTTTRTTKPGTPLQGPSGAGGTAEAFGAGIGRGLSNLAAGTQVLAERVRQVDEQRRRFQALQQFSAFSNRWTQRQLEAKRNAEANLGNFAELTAADWQNESAAFLETIDPEFQEEFKTRLAQVGEGVAADALTFQYERTDQYFRDGATQAYEAGRIALGQNPTKENFDDLMAQQLELVSSSGLSEAEKAALMRQYQKGLSAVLYRAEQTRQIANQDESGGAVPAAANLIEAVSGATPEEATALARQGEQIAVSALGIDLFSQMPARARAALASLTSDLGELPDSVRTAVMSGDLEKVSAAIRALGGERRTQEADLVLDPGAQLDDDPRFSQLPYEDRLALREDALREAKAAITADTAAAAARNEALINALMVQLHDGLAGKAEIDSLREAGVLTDIDDIVKAERILADRDENLNMVLRGQQMLASGVPANPTSTDDKKMLDAMVGKEGIAALQGMNNQYVTQALVPMTEGFQAIPNEALGTLLGMMRSNDQTKALWAMDVLSQLREASPLAFAAQTDDATDGAITFWNDRRNYYPPDQLLSLVNGGRTAQERQEVQFLREEARKVLNASDVNFASLAPRFFLEGGLNALGTPLQYGWAASSLESDFRKLFEDQYVLYRDPRAASEAALNIMKKSWGNTNVGTSTFLMKYPPEQVGYPTIAGRYDWMEEQVRTELYFPSVEDQRNNTNGFPIIGENEGFAIMTDPQTEQEVDAFRTGRGPAPSYTLVRIVDGQPSVVMDPYEPDKPFRIFFDPTTAQKEEDARWREERQVMYMGYEAQQNFERAQQHSLETGIPIPEDAYQPSGDFNMKDVMDSLYGPE